MYSFRFGSSALAFLLLLGFSSCIKDQCVRTFVTYEPVYRSTDLVRAEIGSKPAQPVEHPGKIYIYGPYIFLNELDRGIHVFDNTNPYAPKAVSFINIPGCLDMAVKGDILYADAFTDLVVLDIASPADIKVQQIQENIFPYRYYTQGISSTDSKVVVDWLRRDTTIQVECGSGGLFGVDFSFGMEKVVMAGPACSNCAFSNSNSGGGSPFGMGGSMARFALMNQYLYTVGISNLKVFGLQDPRSPEFGKELSLPWNIETIYPFKNRLFVGSRSGMFLFSVDQPESPVQIGSFAHASACDPVVGDDKYAYITLRSGTSCQGFNNQLDVVNVTDPSKAALLKTYAMSNPHGLSKDGDLLFICDGASGLKVYNAKDPNNLKLLSVVDGIKAYDVIAWKGIALVTAQGGLYQYEYSNPASLKLLSKVEVPF